MMSEMTEEEWAPIRVAVTDFAMHVTEATLHDSASKADIAQSQAISALQKVRRAIEAVVKSRATPDGGTRSAPSHGDPIDNARCKFAGGGARCVCHCGDPACIADGWCGS